MTTNAPINNINNIRQPKPNIGTNAKNQKRKYVLPNVGVVNVPNITRTPLQDTLTVKKQETPKIQLKPLETNRNKGFKFQSICSIGIIASGLLSLMSLFKKK